MVDRRGFLKSTAAATAGLAAGTPAVKSGFMQYSANDVINVAVVGIRSRGADYNGTGHYVSLCKIPNVRVGVLCDVDERLFPKGIAEVEKFGGTRPKTAVDFQEVLDDKSVDAVSLATPDHWHALHTVWACQAGKDVYVEKPISYCIDEGRKMVEAARKYKRVVQAGTQSRSSTVVKEAAKFIQEGKLGKIYMGRAIIYRHRANIGRVPDSPIPEGVHWDMFLGPAPYRPFNASRLDYNWHWFWDYSTTEFGNNGVHAVDRIRLAIDNEVHPSEVQCMGVLTDTNTDQEVPNTMLAHYRYADGMLLSMEVRSVFTNAEDGRKSGSFIYGTEGWMILDTNEFRTYFGQRDEPGPSLTGKDVENEWGTIDRAHFVNFLDCMRSRKWQDLNAEILEGHMSTSIGHLGNIAFRTGRRLEFNSYAEKFINDDDANTYLTRQYRHPYVMPDTV